MTSSEQGIPPATIGVFGGTGLTQLLEQYTEVTVATPWGDPSGPISIGTINGVAVAFLPRHGAGHRWPPHRVNYRANVDAMRQLGVTAVLGPFAAGSLRPDLVPGDVVVVDQFVDRTSGRAETFHDEFNDGPKHLSRPDPYDPRLRAALLTAATDTGIKVHDGGTVVVVNGPRFSTRAESRWFRAQGWDLVNMTQHPEAVLAAEAGVAYAGLAIVTDHDAGVDDDPTVAPVTQEEVFATFERTLDSVRQLLLAAVAPIATELRAAAGQSR
jgi:5'-methylthioadenosine phosphorylase